MKINKLVFKTIIVITTISFCVIPQSALTTTIDKIPPSIEILFAGNMDDLGGPYWLPPTEDISLEGGQGYPKIREEHHELDFSEGYYTNNTEQEEDGMKLYLIVNDPSGVESVIINWYDMTDDIWYNWSYEAIYLESYVCLYKWNSLWDVVITPGHKYSFDVWAEDGVGNVGMVKWEKAHWSGLVRRGVSLGCTPQSIEYKPLYFINQTNLTGDYSQGAYQFRDDILNHDQGADGTSTDVAYMTTEIPGNDITFVYCQLFIGFWYEEPSCIESFTLENIYFHWWISTYNDETGTGFQKSREFPGPFLDEMWWTKVEDAISKIDIPYEGWFPPNSTYCLYTRLLDTDPIELTDNNIFEISAKTIGGNPATAINRSIMSFVIFNVPDDATLLGMDSDGDGLNDYEELYHTYTDPFTVDTDNDGSSDYLEHRLGSDPNNYLDTRVRNLLAIVPIFEPITLS